MALINSTKSVQRKVVVRKLAIRPQRVELDLADAVADLGGDVAVGDARLALHRAERGDFVEQQHRLQAKSRFLGQVQHGKPRGPKAGLELDQLVEEAAKRRCGIGRLGAHGS